MATIVPRISVKEWEPNAAQKELKPGVFKHLDLGSANYGPEERENITKSYTLRERRRWHKQMQSMQSLGEKLHHVLFSNVDRIIAGHPDCKKFVFYLNDISSEGLDKAIHNLVVHLRLTPLDREIKIKIVKIVKSFFEINPFPRVNSATLIAPECCPFAAIASLEGEMVYSWKTDRSKFESETQRFFRSKERRWENPDVANEAKDILGLFQRVASASSEGLLVREIDMDPGTARAVRERFSLGVTLSGLTFATADKEMKSIAPYTALDGRVFSSDHPNIIGIVDYVVTQAKADS